MIGGGIGRLDRGAEAMVSTWAFSSISCTPSISPETMLRNASTTSGIHMMGSSWAWS